MRGQTFLARKGLGTTLMMSLVWILLLVLGLPCSSADLLIKEAQLLKVGRELRGESILAPGSKTYVLSSDGLFPYEAVEVRISHLSLPPAKFTFSLLPFPEDGSVSIKSRSRKSNLRRRRRLNTAITSFSAGKTGALLLENGVEAAKTLLTVNVVPTGVKPIEGLEQQVEVRYNIIVERKVINNAIPETGLRMIGFVIFCLFVSAIVLVPALSAAVRRGDEIINKNKDSEDKQI